MGINIYILGIKKGILLLEMHFGIYTQVYKIISKAHIYIIIQLQNNGKIIYRYVCIYIYIYIKVY